MAGHPLAVVETLHGSVSPTDINFLPDQLVGNAVVVAIEFDVVVNINGGLFSLGVLIGLIRKGFESWLVQSFKY